MTFPFGSEEGDLAEIDVRCLDAIVGPRALDDERCSIVLEVGLHVAPASLPSSMMPSGLSSATMRSSMRLIASMVALELRVGRPLASKISPPMPAIHAQNWYEDLYGNMRPKVSLSTSVAD